MKIAIKGHKSRGKEVIQILESLGGKSREELTGRRISHYYFINYNGDIDLNLKINLLNRKLYTLEEFEKEFPFKIGDKVTTTGTNHPKIITGITDTQWGLRYVISEIKFPDSKEMPHISQISLYKEMKEERNITLTLEKAKEWYKKGGELKEIALQAFTEQELNPLPRSWKEFCKQGNPIASWRYTIPAKYEAFYKLEQLRDCYNNSCNDTNRIAIINNNGNIELYVNPPFNCFLTFKNHSLAREFFSNFKEIIEIAKKLI